MKLRVFLLIQGIYYIITGIWPLLDIHSFMLVTGPKNDIWLVKMVGLLTAAVAVAILTSYKSPNRTVLVLSVSAALAYLAIDVYYVSAEVIGPVYLADAVIEAMLILCIVWKGFLKKDHATGQ
jgi:hypothetical protein